MAFEGLSGRLSEVFKKLKGRGKVKESDIKEVMREVRMGTSGSGCQLQGRQGLCGIGE